LQKGTKQGPSFPHEKIRLQLVEPAAPSINVLDNPPDDVAGRGVNVVEDHRITCLPVMPKEKRDDVDMHLLREISTKTE